MKYEEIIQNEEVQYCISKGNQILGSMGYTDHSEVHCKKVAVTAGDILKQLDYPQEMIDRVMVAGYMHDIGNMINRKNHAEYGGILAKDILLRAGVSIQESIDIASYVSNHDESSGHAFDPISAALIIADKSDVRRSRVRSKKEDFDIHDRVNYAVQDSYLKIDTEKKTITLHLKVDESICTMFEYFEIFLARMMMCRQAADVLGARFRLVVNDSKVL